MEFLIYLQSVISLHETCNLFAVNYQFQIELLIHLQSIINSTQNLCKRIDVWMYVFM